MLTSFVILESENLWSACVSAALAPALTVALRVTPSLLVKMVGLAPFTTAGPGPATGPGIGVEVDVGPDALLVDVGHPGAAHPAHPLAAGVASLLGRVLDLSKLWVSYCSLAAFSLLSLLWLSSLAAVAILFS